jgi:hypothetical protein
LCPATIFKAQDQHLEKELNERVGFVIHQSMSDSDSSESFVEATQNQPNNASSHKVFQMLARIIFTNRTFGGLDHRACLIIGSTATYIINYKEI